MSQAGRAMQRQFKHDEQATTIAHPGGEMKNYIKHTMGPGSRMSQDVYGDSFIKPPKSTSDVFGKEASNQGYRLHKPGE